MGPILNFYEDRVFLISSVPSYEQRSASRNTRPCTSWNRKSAETATGKSQLALIHNRTAEWVAAGGGIFENHLTPHVGVN